jgi:hypothetical protein
MNRDFEERGERERIDVMIGEKVGPYEIREQIGQGGMSIVYGKVSGSAACACWGWPGIIRRWTVTASGIFNVF